jgi:hypothetical protein
MLELIAGILLAAGVIYYVLLPVLRPTVDARDEPALGDEGDDPDDDMSAQTVALRALKEIEFDRATGKLSDQDYDALKAKYTGEALAAMRGEQGAGGREQVVTAAPRSVLPTRACPQHGVRPESAAAFCSACGRRLATAPGYCARCGSSLESDARYCNRCGAGVAA